MEAAYRSVLLVDDNVGLREGLANVLEDEGIATSQAGRGSEALQVARQGRFGLVVLDLNLPDMTGVQVYNDLRCVVRELACVFMTAEASELLIGDALRLNPLQLLRKPFEVQVFREVVRRALRLG